MTNARRILIVDDEQTITELLRFIFEQAQYEVVTARSAKQARACFADSFAVAIFDKNLPDGNGLSLGNELRRVAPFCETILFTGFSNKEAAIEAVGAGFYAYVEKPIDDLHRFAMLVNQAAVKSEMQHQQHRNEQLIEHMRKMDALGRLASGISHDFNNVLAVVGLTAELLSGEDLTLDDVRRHGRELSEAVTAGRALARQLVMFGRSTQAQVKLASLNDVVNGMLALLQSIVGHRAFELQLEPNLLMVNGDQDQLSQVILNLVVNAADATARDGRIKIISRNVLADAPELIERGLPAVPTVVLTVEDNGCGMPPDTLVHIFEPYFTTKGEGKGTGLGLATVFSIAQKHGGRVSVQSTVDKGSRFDVYIPSAD